MGSTLEQVTTLQKEFILYSLNLEKAVELEDRYGIVYYDVLLQFTWKQLEEIYVKYVDDNEMIVTPFCNQIAKSLLEREAHLQDEDYQSFLRLFVEELFTKHYIKNYQLIFEPLSSFGEVKIDHNQYTVILSNNHLKDINIRFNLETIFLQLLKIKQYELKQHSCYDCYVKLKQEKIKAVQKYFPYYFYDFDFNEDSSLELYTNLEFFLYVSKISPRKRKELEREIKKKMEQYHTKIVIENLKAYENKFSFNSYDLLFEQHLDEYPQMLEEEVFQLEYQLKGKRRTLLDIFLSSSKLQKLLEHKNTSEENKKKAQEKIKILNEMIEKSDFPISEIGDVIQFLFTSGLLDKDKKVDQHLFEILKRKYQHMISIFWYRYSDEYVNYLNLVKEIENKLILQIKKNKQLALKDYQRYLENEKQFQEHIHYFESFQQEMNQYFQNLQNTISM